MAVREDILYIAHYIYREMGIGSFIPSAVTAGSTSIRVMNPEIFEPAGGQLIVEANDNLVTYTGIQGSELTGIPATGTGSITANLVAYTGDGSSLLLLPELATTDEMETVIDRYRSYLAIPCMPSSDYTKYFCRVGWLGDLDGDEEPTVELRDTNTDSYTVVEADDDDSETGEFLFDSAQDYEILYAVGYFYNPFYAIGDLVDSLIRRDRWQTYFQVGQTSGAQKDAGAIAKYWRERGRNLALIH